MRVIGAFLGLIFVVVMVLFSLLNAKVVTLHYYFGQVSFSFSGFLIVAFVLGALFGLIIGYIKGCQKRKQHNKQVYIDNHKQT